MKKPTVEERRTEILETTCEVVIERGFAATRIADVAKRLGVSSSLIHYHFDSKEQLLAEAFAHYARKDLAELEAEVEAAPTSRRRSSTARSRTTCPRAATTWSGCSGSTAGARRCATR